MRIASAGMVFCIVVVIAVAVAGVCAAEEYEYKDYTVKKGDTLWDISKSELKDNFQWPAIWKVNPGVANPDRIYPGQVIRIPVSSLKQEAIPPAALPKAPVETPKEEAAPARPKAAATALAPIKVEPVVSVQAIRENGYIGPELPHRGRTSHSHQSRSVFGTGDDIYIDTVAPVEKGHKFYVVRKEASVPHPVTGKRLGFLIRILGVVEVQEPGTKSLKARVVESTASIEKGDALDDYYEIDVPFSAGEPRKPAVTGFVVASRYMKEISGSHEFVFIDKGRADGLELGDIVATLARGTDDRLNSFLQIVNVRDNTSLAYILRGETQVELGDAVTKAE